jgi:hypothetical protein
MSYLNDPKHWRDRAEETRAKAEEYWSGSTRQRMLRIADEYERLADLAAERLRSDAAFVAGESRSVRQPRPRP